MRRAIAIAAAGMNALSEALGIKERVPVEAEVELDPVPDALARARHAKAHQDEGRKRGERFEYGLGFGGKDPNAPHPWQWDAKTKTWRLDCSGLLCWAMRRPRQDPATKVWANTDRFELEAKRQNIAWMYGRPGDGIVYGAGRKIGHCGVKSGKATVIHCASGKAIVETSDALFIRKGAVVWQKPLTAG